MTDLIATLFAHAHERPGYPAIHDGVHTMDYRTLWQVTGELASCLSAQGVQCLALEGDNTLAWIVADIAARRAALTVVPIPGFFSGAQRAHALETAGADHCLQINTATDAPSPTVVLWEGRLALSLTATGLRSVLPDSVSKITFTSGSTGSPKGVCLSAETLDATTSAITDALSGMSIERHLSVMPYATLLENVAGVNATLMSGACIEVRALAELGLSGSGQFDPVRFFTQLAAVAPHSLIIVPQLLLALVTAAERGMPLPCSLRFIAVGGARVSPQLLQRAAAVGLPVYEGYGLSECGSVVCLNVPGAVRPGSVGRPLQHASVRVGDAGNIIVSGSTCLGYWDGDLYGAGEIDTGDIGHVDAEGYVYVTGRRKHMFITAWGRNVNPEWVESELTQRLPILQAAVFGEGLPVNVAVIAIRPGFDEAAIHEAVSAANAHLPDYARISEVLISPTPFTLENRMATANGRLCREAIHAHWASTIQSRMSSRAA